MSAKRKPYTAPAMRPAVCDCEPAGYYEDMLAHAANCPLRVAATLVQKPELPLALFDHPPAPAPLLEAATRYQILFLKPGDSLPDLPGSFYRVTVSRTPTPEPAAKLGDPLTMDQVMRRHVETILSALSWRMTDAAKVLNVDRRTLYRWCKRWALVRP